MPLLSALTEIPPRPMFNLAADKLSPLARDLVLACEGDYLPDLPIIAAFSIHTPEHLDRIFYLIRGGYIDADSLNQAEFSADVFDRAGSSINLPNLWAA